MYEPTGTIFTNKDKVFLEKLEMGKFESQDSVLQPYATWDKQKFYFTHEAGSSWIDVNEADHDGFRHPIPFNDTLFKVNFSLKAEGYVYKRVMTSFWDLVHSFGSLWAGLTLVIVPFFGVYNARSFKLSLNKKMFRMEAPQSRTGRDSITA